jgi:hypothetical protein
MDQSIPLSTFCTIVECLERLAASHCNSELLGLLANCRALICEPVNQVGVESHAQN